MQVNFHVVLLVCSCFLGKKSIFASIFDSRQQKRGFEAWLLLWLLRTMLAQRAANTEKREVLKTQKKGKCALGEFGQARVGFGRGFRGI